MQIKNQSLSEIQRLLERMEEKYNASPNVTPVTEDTFLDDIDFVTIKIEKNHFMYETSIHHILKKRGINTVGELLNHYHTNGNSIKIPRIGPKYKEYIQDFINRIENPQQTKQYPQYNSDTLIKEKLTLEEDLDQLANIITQLETIKNQATDPETLKSLSSAFRAAKTQESMDKLIKKLSDINLGIDTQINRGSLLDSLLKTANNLYQLLEVDKRTKLCKEFNILIGLNSGGGHDEH